jgi:protein-disulfide isomerase
VSIRPQPISSSLARRTGLGAALVGLFASAYLLLSYVGTSEGICLTAGGCDTVRESLFAYPLGIPLPLAGIGFYLAAAWLILRPADLERLLPLRASTALLGLAVAGVGVSTVLAFIQLFVVDAICGWCVVSAGAAVVLLAGALGGRLTERASAETEARSRAVRQRLLQAQAAQRLGDRRFATISGGVLALGFGALLIAGMLGPGEDLPGNGVPERATSGSGPVEVTVFSDFQCPACAAAGGLLHQLVADGNVTLHFRHFPLTQIHPNAVPAAQATEAARLQGRFWELHDRLFVTQSAWSGLPTTDATAFFERLAAEVGVDGARFTVDRQSAAVTAIIEQDLAEARRLALPGTPSIFINGDRYNGPLQIEALRSAVSRAMALTGTP